MKWCSGCKQEKAVTEFSRNKAQKDGLHSQCKVCNKKHYENNKVHIRAVRKRRYYSSQKDSQAYSREWYANNKDRALAAARNWASNNPGKANAIKKRYKTAKQNACPEWLTEWDVFVIEEYYYKAARLKELTGQEYHVDHIHPLQGETVCGLHVPWNLQVLPARVNIQKSNRFW